jgi:hypothetical protein
MRELNRLLTKKEIKDIWNEIDNKSDLNLFQLCDLIAQQVRIKQDAKTANHYETIIIPQKEERAYDIGFETGKEEARIIVENVIIPQRIKEAQKKLLSEIETKFEEVYAKSCDSVDNCHVNCPNPKNASQFCGYYRWQQLKESKGL